MAQVNGQFRGTRAGLTMMSVSSLLAVLFTIAPKPAMDEAREDVDYTDMTTDLTMQAAFDQASEDLGHQIGDVIAFAEDDLTGFQTFTAGVDWDAAAESAEIQIEHLKDERARKGKGAELAAGLFYGGAAIYFLWGVSMILRGNGKDKGPKPPKNSDKITPPKPWPKVRSCHAPLTPPPKPPGIGLD